VQSLPRQLELSRHDFTADYGNLVDASMSVSSVRADETEEALAMALTGDEPLDLPTLQSRRAITARPCGPKADFLRSQFEEFTGDNRPIRVATTILIRLAPGSGPVPQ